MTFYLNFVAQKNLFFFLAVILLSFQANAQKTELSPDAFEKGISKENIQVLDVRRLDEYNSGHIKNALLADWNQRDVFEETIKYLDKTKPVYTYCLAGARSSAAAARLREAGFKEVYSLDGGIKAWKEASRPVEGVDKTGQLTMKEYLQQVSAGQTVLVEIGATWSPPCNKMEPVIKELVQSNGSAFKLVQIDGGVQETLVKELKVTSFPTFIVYKQAKEVGRKEGFVPKEQLLKAMGF